MGVVSNILDFPRVKALAEMHGGKGLTLAEADFNAMARFLAKTAYAAPRKVAVPSSMPKNIPDQHASDIRHSGLVKCDAIAPAA
jgi:hypothetical protein